MITSAFAFFCSWTRFFIRDNNDYVSAEENSCLTWFPVSGVGPPCSVQPFRKRNNRKVFYAWGFLHSFSRWVAFLVFLQRAAFISSGLLLLLLLHLFLWAFQPPQPPLLVDTRFWNVLPFALVQWKTECVWRKYGRWIFSWNSCGVVHSAFFAEHDNRLSGNLMKSLS